jgi:hypothetical protein
MPLVDTVRKIWRGERGVSDMRCRADPIASSDEMATAAPNSKLHTVLKTIAAHICPLDDLVVNRVVN